MRNAAATRAAWQSSSRAGCRPWSDSALLSQSDFPRWSMPSRVLRSDFRNVTGNVFEFRQLSSERRKYDTDTKLDNLTNTKRLLYFYILLYKSIHYVGPRSKFRSAVRPILGSFSMSPVDFSFLIFHFSFSAAIALCVRHFDFVAEITESVCGNFVHEAEITLISFVRKCQIKSECMEP